MDNTKRKFYAEDKPQLVVVKNTIKKIAFMDLDGTIVSSHCVHYLNLIHKGLNGKFSHLLYTSLLRLQGILFHLINYLSCDAFDKYYFNHFKGMKTEGIDKAINDYVLPFIRKRIYPQALKEIDKLRSENYFIVIVSGNVKNVVQPLVKELNVHDCIATELEVKDGCYTGKASKYFVNNENKRKAISEYCKKYDITPESTVAYGNSKWDIPMLELADKAVTVNADKRLFSWANLRQANSESWSLGKIPWENYIMFALFYPFLRKWEGAINIPKYKGAIIIGNHTSYLDHYAIGLFVSFHCKRRVRYLAKKEHFDTPFQKWIHETLGAVPIDRDKGGRAGLETVVDLLNNDDLVLMYPEGTRSRDGLIKQFKPGILFAHFKSGCEIIPVGLNGAFQVLPSGKLMPGFARVSLKFGAPISFVNSKSENKLPRGDVREDILAGLRNVVKNLAHGIYPV